jgi:O-antigen/teichoic acid export membrane protein
LGDKNGKKLWGCVVVVTGSYCVPYILIDRNGAVNPFPQYKRSTKEGYPLLGNGLLSIIFWKIDDGVFRGARERRL